MAAGLPLLPDEEGYWYPNWRIAWEEELEETTRRRIRRAVRAGQVLDDPYEAAFAVTLAVKERRIWRWWPHLHNPVSGTGGLLARGAVIDTDRRLDFYGLVLRVHHGCRDRSLSAARFPPLQRPGTS